MGTLRCGSGSGAIEIDDRLLTHLHTVIVTKLRRNEGFSLNWTDAEGRPRAVWLSQHSAIEWTWAGSRSTNVDPELLDRLIVMASSARGLDLARLDPPRLDPVRLAVEPDRIPEPID